MSRAGDAFVWAGGVRLATTSLRCDVRRCPDDAVAFVSHAGARRPRGAGVRVLSTERAAVLRGRAKHEGPLLLTPFGRPFALGRLRVELLPSGHAPGAAQLLVEHEGRRLTYCGPLNPAGSRFAEPAQVRAAEALCLDAPLAPLGRPLPPRAEVEQALLAAVHRALDDAVTPLLLTPVYPGGVELAALLAEAGLSLRAHGRIVTWLVAYSRIGLTVPMVSTFRGTVRRGEVLLWPLHAEPPPLAPLCRLAATGAALALDAARRLGVDAAFALADHGDLPSLVAHARASEAREVWFTSGLTEEVARAFAAAGIEARPLTAPQPMAQLPLFSA